MRGRRLPPAGPLGRERHPGGDTLVPFEHGDYDNAQESKAKAIAERHVAERLSAVLA